VISEQTIEKIRDASRAEEVIGDFVNLKRRGSNMIGLCPFHSEKTPSFSVSPAKNIYKCFGCGRAGDPIRFLMDHENYNYVEALRYLAAKYGIEIEEENWSPEQQEARQHRDSLHVLNGFAQEYFQRELFETDLGRSVGLSYFKDRGYREEIIRRFGLGFAPRDGKAFTTEAQAKKYKVELLQELGLTTAKGYDFFRGRVIFPIHNLTGKPIAFAGRVLGDTDRGPKYLNSPESEVYHKSKIVYGIHQAQKSIRTLDSCILVEGYTDVLSLAQEGIENVVASSGTALTADQLRLIKRYSSNLVILYDGDEAGLKAATRGLDIALEEDLNVKVVILPPGEDPDSLVRKLGKEAMQEYIQDKGEDVILFKTHHLLEQSGRDPVKKAEISRSVVESIARIPDPIKRSLYLKESARVLDIDESILVSEMNQIIRKLIKQKERSRSREAAAPQEQLFQEKVPAVSVEAPQTAPAKKTSPDGFLEQKIVQLLVVFGEKIFEKESSLRVADYIIGEIEDVIEEVDNPTYKALIHEVRGRVLKGMPVGEPFFLQHPDSAIRQLALDVLHSPWELSEGWAKREIVLGTQKPVEENFVSDSVEAVLRFKMRKIHGLREKNMAKLQSCDSEDTGQQMKLMRVHQKLTEIHNAIARELRLVVPK
jgi:DNA primase